MNRKCPDGMPVPDGQKSPELETYTRFDITTIQARDADHPAGKAHLRIESNDDGYVDPGPIAVWEADLSMVMALSMAGQKSHTGIHGQPVDVYLDGRKV